MVPRGAYVEPLRALGYRWVLDPWDVEHETFSRDIGGERSFHLHVCAAGSTWERRHLVFRDWLRTHPDDAAAYATLKRQLAAAHPNDTLSYTDGQGRLHLRHRRTGDDGLARSRCADKEPEPGTSAGWLAPAVIRGIVGEGTNA